MVLSTVAQWQPAPMRAGRGSQVTRGKPRLPAVAVTRWRLAALLMTAVLVWPLPAIAVASATSSTPTQATRTATRTSRTSTRAILELIRKTPVGGTVLKIDTGVGRAVAVKTDRGVKVFLAGQRESLAPSNWPGCDLVIQGLVYGLGAAFFGALAAAGGGVVLGVAIGADIAGGIAAALAGGTATAAYLSSIFCR